MTTAMDIVVMVECRLDALGIPIDDTNDFADVADGLESVRFIKNEFIPEILVEEWDDDDHGTWVGAQLYIEDQLYGSAGPNILVEELTIAKLDEIIVVAKQYASDRNFKFTDATEETRSNLEE